MAGTLRSLLNTEPFDEDEDPNAAPSAYCGPDPARRFTPRRALQNMVWTYAFGLLFMAFTVGDLTAGDPSSSELTFRIAVHAAFALVYLASALVADLGLVVRWVHVGVFLGTILLTIPTNGWGFVNQGVFMSVLLALLIPWRTARWALLVWNLFILATVFADWSFGPLIVAIMGLLFGWAIGGAIESARVRRRLTRAEQRLSVLSVAAERERIARDLHDILGHSLTAVSIKSGLAGKLVDADPEAAKDQMAEVEQIARVALADVRATTTGMREVRLATELASARSVLMAAGVDAVTPTALPPLSETDSELLGYVVREAVTNVVRHAEATRCVITVTEDGVTVADDGIGIRAGSTRGTGMAGLRRRAQEAGATLHAEPGRPRGTVISATVAHAGAASPVPELSSAHLVEGPEPLPSPEPVEGQPTEPVNVPTAEQLRSIP